MRKKKCPYCGEYIEKSSKFCEICGREVRKKSKKKMWIGGVICFVIAGTGIGIFWKQQQPEAITLGEKEIKKQQENGEYITKIINDYLDEKEADAIVSKKKNTKNTSSEDTESKGETEEKKEVKQTSENEEITGKSNLKVEENAESINNTTNMTQEEKIQQIRNVYYDIQGKLSQYAEYTGYEGLQVYYEGSNVKKIVSENGTTTNPEYVLPSGYSAEFFYDNNTLVFVFVYKGTEEYRFYIDPDDEEKCIRYIGTDGVIQDFEESVNPVEQFGNMGRFCEAGYEEPYWMDIK